MNEPIGHRPINWAAVGVLATLGAYAIGGTMAFTVVREQGSKNEAAIAAQADDNREQNDRIRAIENNRSLEQQIADLKNEVVRLSTLIESGEKKRGR